MSASLVKGKNINTDNVSFSTPRTLDNGAKLVYVNYKGGRFNVQTPWLDVPWDLSCYTEGPYPKYSMELSFSGMDEDPEIRGFHDKFVELEQKIIDEGCQERNGIMNGVSWFKLPKAKCTPDVIASKFGPIVKVSKDKETGEPDGKWPSTMKLKIPCRDGVFEPKFVSHTGETYNVNGGDNLTDIIVKRARVRCIIQCVGLWIASGNYMCQWKLVRADVEVPESANAETFLPDSDDEGDGAPAPVQSAPKMIEDSDDEDGEAEPAPTNDDDSDDSDDADPEPAPPPAPVKKARKVVRKKKTGN